MTEPPIVNQPLAARSKMPSAPVAKEAAAASGSQLNAAQLNAAQSAGIQASAARGATTSTTRRSSVLDQRWFVLAAIFLAMMFLGLPLLWRCPAFSRLEKVVWTVLTLIYSAVVIWVFVLVMSWSWRNIMNALGNIC